MTGFIRLFTDKSLTLGSSCDVIDSGKLDPDAVMAKDASLLEQLNPEGRPIIHFYEWSVPCLTYGYFTDPGRHLDLKALEVSGLHLARRPTGGGIIFHLTDFAFSVLIPANHPSFSQNTLENYALVNRPVAFAISEIAPSPPGLHSAYFCPKGESPSFCMAKPTLFDLVIEGKKVGGAAQRRTRKGLLHQASLSVCLPPFGLLEKVLRDRKVLVSMRENSDCLFPAGKDLHEGRRKIKELLLCIFCRTRDSEGDS